ncbi:MAG: RNA polymerase sigma-70 factor [Balneolales bacterium]|nr:RNA polymerase sigma-70 factor [Balneolales bacterium]
MDQLTNEKARKLLADVACSNKHAFDELFRSMYTPLVIFSSRYVHDRQTACDVVQDAFIKIWQKREDLGDIDQAKAYIYRAVRNLSLNHIRDHSNTDTGLEFSDSENEVTVYQLHAGKQEIYAESVQDQKEEENDFHKKLNLVKTWIQKLPKRQREAFELSRFEGLDHQEIAEIMKVSARTVNNHIVEALKNLQQFRSVHEEKQTFVGHG